MYRTNLKLVRGVFGALVVGALGFGAAQAVASPATAPHSALSCTMSQRYECRTYCASQGTAFVSCSVSGGEVNCECA